MRQTPYSLQDIEKKLFSAVIADALDGLGYRNQSPNISFRAYTGIYKMVLEELEVVSRVLDVQLKMEMEDQLKWWFYNEITGREHDAKKLSTYCGEQFLNIFHQYAATQRKIYSPFGY